ncbi:hypothetical protein [Vibrio owensii]|jgi:hypothetical protein|uniref:hypothetical protein n=1 Tax=Vibrio owensii TaxID=696485 RepID=UPI00221EAAC6|nr:hypothetical protein [Vibrio owensii]
MKKLLIGLFGILLSFNSYSEVPAPANYQWYGPYTIKSVARYINRIHSVTITVNDNLETTCDFNNTTKTLTNVHDNHVNVDGIYGGGLTAQAQNKKVKLLLGSTCVANKGLDLLGIEILSDN